MLYLFVLDKVCREYKEPSPPAVVPAAMKVLPKVVENEVPKKEKSPPPPLPIPAATVEPTVRKPATPIADKENIAAEGNTEIIKKAESEKKVCQDSRMGANGNTENVFNKFVNMLFHRYAKRKAKLHHLLVLTLIHISNQTRLKLNQHLLQCQVSQLQLWNHRF